MPYRRHDDSIAVIVLAGVILGAVVGSRVGNRDEMSPDDVFVIEEQISQPLPPELPPPPEYPADGACDS